MTRPTLRAALISAFSGLLAACNLLFSLDDYAAPELASCSTCAAERCACAPKAPSGFDYARLRVPAGVDDLCPAGTVAGVAMGQGAKDTGCDCQCDGPAPGAPCALAIYSGKGCQGAPTTTLTSSTCTDIGVTGDSSAAVIPAATTGCQAKAAVHPPDFAVRVLACLDQAPSQGGCDDRTTCAAALEPPFDPSPCIVAQPGEKASCPESYSHKYLFVTTLDDQRSCDASGCTCSPQQCPTTTVTLCQDPACQTNCGLTAESFTNCKDFAGLTHGRVDVDGTTQGTCQPGGQATSSGSVTASGSVVVCCRSALPKASYGDGGS
jgi:hypothetical protein